MQKKKKVYICQVYPLIKVVFGGIAQLWETHSIPNAYMKSQKREVTPLRKSNEIDLTSFQAERTQVESKTV